MVVFPDHPPHAIFASPCLRLLQALVGGYIEAVAIRSPELLSELQQRVGIADFREGAPPNSRPVLLVNDSALIDGRNHGENVIASALCGQRIIGAAVVCALD